MSIDGSDGGRGSLDGGESSASNPQVKRARRGPAARVLGHLQLYLFVQSPGGLYQQLPGSHIFILVVELLGWSQ